MDTAKTGGSRGFVHLLLEVNSQIGIVKLVGQLKGFSVHTLKKEFIWLKQRPPCMWTRSKFVSTVGAVTLGGGQKVDRFFPSSKVCRYCGVVNDGLRLHHRFWVCNTCGAEHDRDVSAAINILEFCTAGAAGFKACGEAVRLDSLFVVTHASLKQETPML